MQDNFGRTIEYLRLSVTDRCNLRCRYCMPEAGVPPVAHHEVLSYEEMLRIATSAVGLGVRKIRVTGGEPLVRKGIAGFIEKLASLPQKPEIVLTTNGLLLADMAAELKGAGLSRVNVSLDTLRPERFRRITRREGLSRVLDGLEAAEACGLSPLKINMVPILGANDDEIADFARLTLERPWEVRFIEFMPVSGGLDYSPANRVPAETIKDRLAAVGPLAEIPRSGLAGPARLFRYERSPGRVGLIPAVSEHFCGQCNRLRVTATGTVRPCLLADAEIDLRAALRETGNAEALERALLAAAGAKPQQHGLGDDKETGGHRPMQQIGG